jgi:hypothetical protein
MFQEQHQIEQGPTALIIVGRAQQELALMQNRVLPQRCLLVG